MTRRRPARRMVSRSRSAARVARRARAVAPPPPEPGSPEWIEMDRREEAISLTEIAAMFAIGSNYGNP